MYQKKTHAGLLARKVFRCIVWDHWYRKYWMHDFNLRFSQNHKSKSVWYRTAFQMENSIQYTYSYYLVIMLLCKTIQKISINDFMKQKGSCSKHFFIYGLLFAFFSVFVKYYYSCIIGEHLNYYIFIQTLICLIILLSKNLFNQNVFYTSNIFFSFCIQCNWKIKKFTWQIEIQFGKIFQIFKKRWQNCQILWQNVAKIFQQLKNCDQFWIFYFFKYVLLHLVFFAKIKISIWKVLQNLANIFFYSVIDFFK